MFRQAALVLLVVGLATLALAEDPPDAKSPELHGAYAHALKSVVVGPDGAVYFSIGSTGNSRVGVRQMSTHRHSPDPSAYAIRSFHRRAFSAKVTL